MYNDSKTDVGQGKAYIAVLAMMLVGSVTTSVGLVSKNSSYVPSWSLHTVDCHCWATDRHQAFAIIVE